MAVDSGREEFKKGVGNEYEFDQREGRGAERWVTSETTKAS